MDILAVSLHFECWMLGGIVRALLLKMHVYPVCLSFIQFVYAV